MQHRVCNPVCRASRDGKCNVRASCHQVPVRGTQESVTALGTKKNCGFDPRGALESGYILVVLAEITLDSNNITWLECKISGTILDLRYLYANLAEHGNVQQAQEDFVGHQATQPRPLLTAIILSLAVQEYVQNGIKEEDLPLQDRIPNEQEALDDGASNSFHRKRRTKRKRAVKRSACKRRVSRKRHKL